LHCIALHRIVQFEVHFNLRLTALRSMRLQWICFFLCSIWNAFQLKPNSTEIYENYVFVFQHVMHFSLSLRFALHSEEQEKRCPRWNQIHLVSVTCLFGLYLGKGITKLWLYVCGWRLIGFNVAVKTATRTSISTKSLWILHSWKTPNLAWSAKAAHQPGRLTCCQRLFKQKQLLAVWKPLHLAFFKAVETASNSKHSKSSKRSKFDQV